MRSKWKGPYVAVSLLQDVIALARKHPEWWNKGRFMGVKAPETIDTKSRASTILPDFLRCKFGVYNGRTFMPVEVTEAMIGKRLGEFSPSKKVPEHKAKEVKAGAKRINPKTGKAG